MNLSLLMHLSHIREIKKQNIFSRINKTNDSIIKAGEKQNYIFQPLGAAIYYLHTEIKNNFHIIYVRVFGKT